MPSAISSAEPIFFIGFLCFIAAIFSSVFNNFSESSDLTSEGATALTLMFGASSAANEIVKEEIAPFAIAIDA